MRLVLFKCCYILKAQILKLLPSTHTFHIDICFQRHHAVYKLIIEIESTNQKAKNAKLETKYSIIPDKTAEWGSHNYTLFSCQCRHECVRRQ